MQALASNPAQSPLHVSNSLAPSGVAVSETLDPAGKAREQVLAHEMPAGDELTIPPPGPAADADSGYPGVAVSVTIADGSNNAAHDAPSPQESRPVTSVTEPPAPGTAVSRAIRAVTRLVPSKRSRSRSVVTPGMPGLAAPARRSRRRPATRSRGPSERTRSNARATDGTRGRRTTCCCPC